MLDLLPKYDGALGLFIAMGIADVMRGLLLGFAWSTGVLRSGDFNWPPSGELEFLSGGRLIGPKGETPSCTLSHDPSVGARGGLVGSHGTSVVFITDALRDLSLATGFRNREKER